jgi:hypothetical protein
MTMADAPQIKVSGAGSPRAAGQLGRAIGDGVATAVAGRDRPLHIDTLRLQLRAGAGRAEIERTIRRAIERQVRRDQR